MEVIGGQHKVTTTIPECLYDYLGTLGKAWYNLNKRLIIQNAYNYCEELTKEELNEKLAFVASKHYNLFTHKTKTKLVHIDTIEPMQKYQSNILITMYVLIFLYDHKEELGITEEFEFNV
jgi:hypothetical protein